MGHGGDVIAELSTDHREVDTLFDEIDRTASAEERKRLVDQLTIELVRHSVAEEMYLYPAVREQLAGGDALADKEIADHAEVEELLKALEVRPVDDQEFDRLIARLKAEVTSHVQDEETRLFPRLRAECSPTVLDDLGDKIRTAKKVAPTRPHPIAPDTPPGNKLLAPGAGLVDRARDFVSGRGR
ncbi:hemerythrin domain-containing protein [Streptomyces sp. NPDC047108]|uniref:hemerythrin domain-containing protein n=1 Tax=Streptomyces sp. NPDC047108 TaxID=3155025 RepID=UPI0033D29009